MVDSEPQIAEDSTGETLPSTDKSASHSGAHGPGKRSGITWWEACGGWSSRYSLSL
jgi:hypothetical protein